MYNVESREDELRGGAFAWVAPVVLVVLILALSWTSLFVVVSDLIEAASHTSVTTNIVRE